MDITIYAAVSADGFIADTNGDTDWVQDWDIFEQTCKKFGCITMGRSTYEEGGSVFDGVEHIVLSTKVKKPKQTNVHQVDSPEAAMFKAEELGFSKLLVIGGSQTNESFAKTGMVKRVILDHHPIKLGKGKKTFGDAKLQLKELSSKQYLDFIHKEYKVNYK